MASNFPGIEEMMQQLARQRALEEAAARRMVPNPTMGDMGTNFKPGKPPIGPYQFPEQAPSMSAVPNTTGTGVGPRSVMSTGNAAGTGREVLSRLKGLGGSVFAAAPLIPSAWSAGKYLGNKTKEFAGRGTTDASGDFVEGDRGQRLLREKEMRQTLPSMEEMGAIDRSFLHPSQTPVEVGPTPAGRDHAALRALAGPDYPVQQPGPEVHAVVPWETQGNEAPTGVQPTDFAPAPVDAMAESDYLPPEMAPQPEQSREMDPYLAQIASLMQLPPARAPQEEIDPASYQAINDLTKNKVEPTKPKGGFLRGLNKFVTAGAGPWDTTRLDRQEADLNQAQNRFTDPEKFRGGIAEKDVDTTRRFNQLGKMAEYESGGMSPQLKSMWDMIMGEKKGESAMGREEHKMGVEHGHKMAEIGAGAASQKLTPGMQQAMFLQKFATEFPDVIGSEGLKVMGVNPDPAALKSVTVGRERQNLMQAMMAEQMKPILEEMNRKSAARRAIDAMAGTAKK